jgi:hypothetical protein
MLDQRCAGLAVQVTEHDRRSVRRRILTLGAQGVFGGTCDEMGQVRVWLVPVLEMMTAVDALNGTLAGALVSYPDVG